MECKEKDRLKEKIDFFRINNINYKMEYEIRNVLKYENVEIKSRIKDFNSAFLKYKEKGYKSIEEIKDLIGIMIICKDIEQIYLISEKLQENMNIIKVKDYIKKPKMGYKSLHLNMQNREGIICEIQLKTKAMKRAQMIVHDYIYKNKKMPKLFKKILSPLIFNLIMTYEKISSKEMKRFIESDSVAF